MARVYLSSVDHAVSARATAVGPAAPDYRRSEWVIWCLEKGGAHGRGHSVRFGWQLDWGVEGSAGSDARASIEFLSPLGWRTLAEWTQVRTLEEASQGLEHALTLLEHRVMQLVRD